MNAMQEKMVYTGMLALVSLSGIMGLVFISYIKTVLKKIDDVSQIGPLIISVEALVMKVEKMFTTLEVTKETTALQVEQLKDRVKRLEHQVQKIQIEKG